jgi:ribosome-binding protein aMBF1 (putative translation factor)
MTTYAQMKARLLANENVQRGYAAAEREHAEDAARAREAISGLADALRELREAAGLSQRELADAMGVAQAEIHRIESPGQSRGPSIETLVRLASAHRRKLVIGFVDEAVAKRISRGNDDDGLLRSF